MRLLGVVLLASLLAAPKTDAGERKLPDPGARQWQPLEFSRISKHTRYEVVNLNGEPALRATSHCSASGLVLPLEGVDLVETPRLRWRWLVERPLATDASERAKDGDDFPARVYVAFTFVPERAGLLERARQRLGQSLYGEQIPGSAINYVWSRAEPEGATWDNPFSESSKMVSLAQGPGDAWRVEEVDLRADYRRLFGAEPPAPLFLALMTDSDNTCGEAQALYADFWLRSPPPNSD
jgi:hypothetical protein